MGWQVNQNGGQENGVGLGMEWTGHADLCGKTQGRQKKQERLLGFGMNKFPLVS